MRRLLFLGGLAACGRVSFDPRTDSSVVDVAIDSGPADPTLLVHYKLDDDPMDGVLDSSGHGNHGTCIGICADVAAGRIGEAYSFDGSLDPIQVPDLRPAQVTLSAWVFRTANTPQAAIVSKPIGPDEQNSWQLVVDGLAATYNLAWCATQQDTVGECAGSAAPVTLNAWRHVAFVYDGTRPHGFLDGVEFVGTLPTLSIGYDAEPILIGGDLDFGAYVAPFNGRIDDVRIYDRALTVVEINALAAGQEP